MASKVVICGNRFLYKEAEKWKRKLEDKGYKVIAYPKKPTKSLRAYKSIHINHYKKITQTDILFVLNKTMDKITNRVGPSVFAEIAFAIGLNTTLGKKIQIYLLNPLPKNMPYSEELVLWKKIGWIKLWKESK